jgi:hypothetical protein
MNPLADKFIRELEHDARKQEHLANETENDAKQHGQLTAFAPHIANLRGKAAETRELIENMRNDPALK